MKKFSIIFLVLLACIQVLSASEAKSDVISPEYTYERLRNAMTGNNPEIRKAEQVYIQSTLDVKNAKAAYQPQITSALTATYMPNPPIGKISYSVDELSSQLGVTIPGAASGEYLTLYKGMDKTYYNAGISITQPVFTWGKIPESVKLYQRIADIRALDVSDKENKLTAELKTRLTAMKYMEDVIAKLNDTKALADELVEASNDAYQNGMLLKQDVTKAKITAMELDVKEQEVLKEYRDNLQAIRSLIGDDELSAEMISYEINDAEMDAIAAIGHDDLYKLATRDDSAPLSMLTNQQEALRLKEKIAKNSLYWKPDLGIQVSLSYGGSAFPLIETNWYRKNDYGIYLTFAVKATLWDGGKKLNDVKYAASEIKAAEADYDSALLQLSSAAEASISQLELSEAKLEYYELKLEEANDRLSLLETQKSAGTVSKTDILSQRIEVNTEELSILQEKITRSQSIYTLAYLAGIIE